MTKPSSYRLKTDWTCNDLRVCKSCWFFEDLYDDPGCESCTHPDHYWQGTYVDGPEWNGFCDDWESEITIAKTQRGFRVGEFEDAYGQKCSIQESSSACAPRIWLGVTNTGPRLKGPNGEFNQDVFGRMHLTLKDVGNLIPLLEHFFKYGKLPEETVARSKENT